MKWVKLIAELAYDLGDEWLKERKKRKADSQWAATVAPIRACFKCKEIAYIQGQIACNKCGTIL